MTQPNSKRYKDILVRIERMADGIGRHKTEEKFPSALDEADRRKIKADLEDARADYEQKRHATDLSYDNFNSMLIAAEGQLSKDDNTLRGFYGKDNAIVADFGTNVFTKLRASRKAKKTEPEPAPTPASAKS